MLARASAKRYRQGSRCRRARESGDPLNVTPSQPSTCCREQRTTALVRLLSDWSSKLTVVIDQGEINRQNRPSYVRADGCSAECRGDVRSAARPENRRPPAGKPVTRESAAAEG